MTTACERYADAIRTPSGLTPADPVGLIGSWWDYSEWKQVAERFVQLVRRNADLLVEKTGDGNASWNALELEKRLREMPGFWSLEAGPDKLMSYEEASQMAINLAQDAACELAEIEDALDGAAAIPFTPGGGGVVVPDEAVKIAGGVGLLAAGALLLWLWRRD